MPSYGYTGEYGASRPFVGVLDTLSGLPYSAWSFARRLTARYEGPVGRVLRENDNVELDVFGRGRHGLVDPSELRQFCGWNMMQNSIWEHTGARPTNWSWGGTGVATPTASTLFPGETAYTLAASAERPYLMATTISVKAGVTYVLSFYIEAISASGASGQAAYNIGFDTLLSGTSDYQVCSANPAGTSSGVLQVGRLVRTVTPGTDGTIRCRLGLGVPNTATGTIRISRPQFEVGTTPTTYQPRTNAQSGAGNLLWKTLYDQTGAGRHFTQSDPALMPYACRNGVPFTENGKQSAGFVAAEARRMAVPSSTALYNFLHTTGGSIHSIARPNDTGALKNILGNKNGSTASGIHWYYDTSERLNTDIGLINIAGVATAGRSVGITHQTMSAANAHGMLVVDPDAPTASDRGTIYRNNVASSTPNAQTGTPWVANAAGVLTLGSRENANNLPFDGTITEVAIWNSLIGSGDRGLLWSNASSLWNL